MEEEQFEDVGLEDENTKPAAQPPKKKGIFSRFGDFASTGDAPSSITSNFPHLPFYLPGRRRGQSGAGSELGAMKPAHTEHGAERS